MSRNASHNRTFAISCSLYPETVSLEHLIPTTYKFLLSLQSTTSASYYGHACYLPRRMNIFLNILMPMPSSSLCLPLIYISFLLLPPIHKYLSDDRSFLSVVGFIVHFNGCRFIQTDMYECASSKSYNSIRNCQSNNVVLSSSSTMACYSELRPCFYLSCCLQLAHQSYGEPSLQAQLMLLRVPLEIRLSYVYSSTTMSFF